MVINSLHFLYFIVPIFFLYYLLKRKLYQNLLLLAGSYIFYGIANVKLLILLIVVSAFIYGTGLILAKHKNKYLLSFGIICCVGLLLYFKYLNFFIDSFALLVNFLGFQSNIVALNLIIPIGISFFTFRLISYLVDIYQEKIKSIPNIVNFATYISFFPTILSGPIDKAANFLPQLDREHKFNYQLATNGLKQILWGMFKKMVIADNLATLLTNESTLNGAGVVFTSVLYSFQIYADFSGYSDMSIGVGKLLGFDIAKNFNYPYFSKNVAEFWRRWHISLLSWFRDYIYIPLGGSRCSKIKVIRNTFIIFLISGLWHGANWTFIIWGLYHALLFLPVLFNPAGRNKNALLDISFKNIISILWTFILITIGWMIFRSADFSQFLMMVKQLYLQPTLIPNTGIRPFILPILLILFMLVLEWKGRNFEFPLLMNLKRKYAWSIYIVLALLIFYYQGVSSDFIYFKF